MRATVRRAVVYGILAWAPPALGPAQSVCAPDLLRLGASPEASAVPGLIACSRAADAWSATRLAAFGALAALPAPRGDALRRLAEGTVDPDARIRKLAVAALSGVGPGLVAVLDSLVEGLEHRDSSVRRAAASLLGSAGLGAASAMPALYGALRDEDARVREEARRAIRAVRGQ